MGLERVPSSRLFIYFSDALDEEQNDSLSERAGVNRGRPKLKKETSEMKAFIATLVLVAPFALAQAADTKTTATTTTTETKAETATTTAPADKTVTVEGPIAQVVARKKEIYVQGTDKKYEFYFTPKTELTKAGQAVDFATLTEGMKVRVTANKVGKRLDPVKVEVLQ